MQKHIKYPLLASIICILAATFYLYEFTLQVSLGVMTHELMLDMGLNAAGIGLVSAFYFYAYTPMQIPAGLLHDRFGPRVTLTFAILTCALGAAGFYFCHNIPEASAARFLMGVGSAFSFSGALMLISRWFPPAWFAILSGIVQLMSSLGAIGGELPLAVAIRHWGWRNSMGGLALIGILLAALVWAIVRNNPPGSREPSHSIEKQFSDKPHGLRTIFRSKDTWFIAAYSFLIWAPIIAFAGLWGVPFLVAAYPELNTETASMVCAMIWIGIGIGSPLCGWASEILQRRRTILAMCGLFGVFSSLAVIYLPLPMPALSICLFVLGLAGGGQSLAFCVVRDISHPDSLGASIGLNNMATVAGGAIIQPLIGCILYLTWQGDMLNHVPVYDLSNYQISLLVIPVCYLLATVISLRHIKETHCRQIHVFGARHHESPHQIVKPAFSQE